MAKFSIAEAITGINEGGFADNKADTGGLTYMGVSQNNWPKWEGWKTVKSLISEWQNLVQKNKPSLASYVNSNGKLNAVLQKQVSQFYKQNFWDLLKLDYVNDQQLANSIYDFGVNSGTGRSAKFLQKAVNSVCDGADLVVDGMIGSKTVEEVNKHDAETIYNAFHKLREEFYRSIANGSQAQFLKSWLSRLKPYQK